MSKSTPLPSQNDDDHNLFSETPGATPLPPRRNRVDAVFPRGVTRIEELVHGINQQVTAISGYNDFARAAKDGTDRTAYHQAIDQAVETIVRLGKDAVDAEKTAIIDLREHVHLWGQTKKLSPLRPDVSFLYEAMDGPHHVELLPTEFDEIMATLFDNALEAIDGAGQVFVTVRDGGRSEQYGEGSVQLSIADTGRGIPREIQDQIFTPRFTTKAQGHGVGLIRVQKILDRRHGEITFRSEPGAGTVFLLTFAREQPPNPSAN